MSHNWEVLQRQINKLGDSQLENEIKDYAVFLKEDRGRKLQDIGAFIEDPVANFERIKGIDDICVWLAEYERRFNGKVLHEALKSGRVSAAALGRNGLPSESILEVFFKKHFREIDEKKIEIVIHMVLQCGGRIYGVLVAGEAAKIFNDNPRMFVGVLKKTREWKRVIDEIAPTTSDYFTRGLSHGLEKLGDSQFEKQIKKYVLEDKKRAISSVRPLPGARLHFGLF